MNVNVRLNNVVRNTTALGPGVRSAIWFQGCLKRCHGCMSPSTRDLNGGREVAVERLLYNLLRIENIEGVTISGGEPFLQIDALYELVKGIKNRSKLSVIIYTGYTLEELKLMKNEKVDGILSCTDILIDGEYREELNDNGSLRGSSNQIVHFLTDRYTGKEKSYGANGRGVEINVSESESVMIGVPSKDFLENWKRYCENSNDR